MITNDSKSVCLYCEPFAFKMAPLKEIGLDVLREIGLFLEGRNIINLHRVNQACRGVFKLQSQVAQIENFKGSILLSDVPRVKVVLEAVYGYYNVTRTDYPQGFFNMKNAIANVLSANKNDTPTPPRKVQSSRPLVVSTGNVARCLF